jgi:hypothetical protein
MKPKKDIIYSFDHVNQRLKERFDLSPMTMEEFDFLSNDLRIDKSNVILVENDDQEIHMIQYKGKKIIFVYSIGRGYITTAMKWAKWVECDDERGNENR